MVVRCIIVVMLVGFSTLTWIIFSSLNKDDENEKIFRDFFRFFRKIELDLDDIALTFDQFLAFYNVSSSNWQECEYFNIWFIYTNNNNTEKFYIRFKTYGDQMKYRLWRRNKRKREETLHKVRETNRFIENIRQQSIRAEQEAKEEARKLRERIVSELGEIQ
jgi:hypothetical protein|uniref:Uncharacterized protein n=1 Tax=Siphoviridae sp. ctsf32 TaxID=2827594 RepID=A0A8S5LNL7_9CAUD|nr:MAG TPA: hypothetical protein [Siphoviridae sp. ctsf32]